MPAIINDRQGAGCDRFRPGHQSRRHIISQTAPAFEPSITLPEPLTGVRPVRSEDQHWQRLGRAEGWLKLGYDTADRPVRIEYHWVRFFSRANPHVEDVYTAELWSRQPQGHWLYIIQPGQDGFVAVEHEPLRDLLSEHLNIDLGD